jgi:GTPase SAR1 family protein
MSNALIAQITVELLATRLRLEAIAAGSPAARRFARLIGRLHGRLTRPPRVVLLGEFNSGKTTLANALIGADVLPTSIHANTRIPIHVHHSPSPTLSVALANGIRRPLDNATMNEVLSGRARMLHVGLAAERLKLFELIDTPGLASGDFRLDKVNLDACRQANIAIWCTACTQAWKATETLTWQSVSKRLHRNGLLIATLADALNTERDRSRVAARLRHEAGGSFAGVAMVTAAEVDELRRNPDAPDHAERWISSGAENLDAELARLVDQVWSDRRAATGRLLIRAAARMAHDNANQTARPMD